MVHPSWAAWLSFGGRGAQCAGLGGRVFAVKGNIFSARLTQIKRLTNQHEPARAVALAAMEGEVNGKHILAAPLRDRTQRG